MATIVCLPGLPLSSAMFDQVADSLSHHHTVKLLDYPGFNGRELADGLGFDDYVAAVQDEIVAIGEPVVIAGVSFGAQLAMQVAIAAPESVSALVLSNTQGSPLNEQEAGMFNQAADAAEAHGSGALVDMLTGMLLAPGTRERRPEAVSRFAELTAQAPGPATASAFRVLANRPDPAAFAPNVEVPVLLVYGTDDGAVPVSEAEVLESLLPDAIASHIRGCGHLPPLEVPGPYMDTVRGFVD